MEDICCSTVLNVGHGTSLPEKNSLEKRMKMEKHRSEILVDVMLNDRYICQFSYNKRGFPTILDDGSIIETVDLNDITKYVNEQIALKSPSLIGKDYRLEFSSQKVR